jgi:hypothetical protein
MLAGMGSQGEKPKKAEDHSWRDILGKQILTYVNISNCWSSPHVNHFVLVAFADGIEQEAKQEEEDKRRAKEQAKEEKADEKIQSKITGTR